MKKFKEEDLILYLYKDCPPKLACAIEEALAEDDLALKSRLNILRRTIKQLDKLRLKSPSKQSIKTILKVADNAGGKK